MSESKNVFMDKIITVEKALKWFEDKEKVCSGYRGQITESELANKENSKMEEFIANWNDNKNEMNVEGFNIFDVFESDSSFFAWKHYTKHYNHIKGPDGTPYDFDKLYWGVHKNTKTKKFFYVLSAITKDKRKSKKFKYACPRQDCLRGDCDFNFDGTSAFDDMLFTIGSPGAALLDNCKSMHHSLLNFSLMQTIGDLQGLKRTFASERLDCFLSFLDGYYKIHLEDVRMRLTYLTWKKDGTERACKNVANIACLNHYLSQFDNIYDYCAKIYFLPTKNHHTGMMKNEKVFNKIAPLLDKEGSAWHNLLESNAALINALITSGEKEFLKNTAENTKYNQELAKDYMRLAVHFWKAKEDYFRLMDEIPENEKKQ